MARYGIVFGLNGVGRFVGVDYGAEIINEDNGDHLLLLEDKDYSGLDLDDAAFPTGANAQVYVFLHGGSTYRNSQLEYLERQGVQLAISPLYFSHGPNQPNFPELQLVFIKGDGWQDVLGTLLGAREFVRRLAVMEEAAVCCVNNMLLPSSDSKKERDRKLAKAAKLKLDEPLDYDPSKSDIEVLDSLLPCYLSLFKH